MRSSIENKTVRPGLMGYSFYASSRAPVARKPLTLPKRKINATRHHFWPVVVSLAVIVGLVLGVKSVGFQLPAASHNAQAGAIISTTHQQQPKVLNPVAGLNCASNTEQQLIRVSISARHLWACQGNRGVYDTAVVTGMESYVADKTPLGNYKIYAKQSNLTLTGSDSTGSWSDPVSYWMPFLNNQYGSYGLHDAPWRQNSAFGNIDPNSNQASHGCIELPNAASKWLYEWVVVGTTVSIQT